MELLESARQEAERLGMAQLAHQMQALTAQLDGQEAGSLTLRNQRAELARIKRSAPALTLVRSRSFVS